MPIVALVIALIASNVFWANVCFKFVNRLMARDYTEFKLAERKPQKTGPHLVLPETDEFAEAQAREINSLMGM